MIAYKVGEVSTATNLLNINEKLWKFASVVFVFFMWYIYMDIIYDIFYSGDFIKTCCLSSKIFTRPREHKCHVVLVFMCETSDDLFTVCADNQ